MAFLLFSSSFCFGLMCAVGVKSLGYVWIVMFQVCCSSELVQCLLVVACFGLCL